MKFLVKIIKPKNPQLTNIDHTMRKTFRRGELCSPAIGELRNVATTLRGSVSVSVSCICVPKPRIFGRCPDIDCRLCLLRPRCWAVPCKQHGGGNLFAGSSGLLAGLLVFQNSVRALARMGRILRQSIFQPVFFLYLVRKQVSISLSARFVESTLYIKKLP